MNSAVLAVSVIWASLSANSPRTRAHTRFYGPHLHDKIFVPLKRCLSPFETVLRFTLVRPSAGCSRLFCFYLGRPACLFSLSRDGGLRVRSNLRQCASASCEDWLFHVRGKRAVKLQVGCPLDPTWAFSNSSCSRRLLIGVGCSPNERGWVAHRGGLVGSESVGTFFYQLSFGDD